MKSKDGYLVKLINNIKKHYELYLMITPVLLYYIVFHYIPMYGAQIAFRDYYPGMNIWEAPWVGFDFLKRFFSSYRFSRLLFNTLRLSLLGLVLGAPLSPIFAIMLNEVTKQKVKKVFQTVSYAPHFISIVAIGGMIMLFLSPNGFFNGMRSMVGLEMFDFMASPDAFPWIYVLSGIWQNCGFGSIIYMAALAGVDQQLYEAAKIDGASTIKKISYIDIPMIIPTFVILLILNCGSILSVGWEKALMLQNSLNISTSEIISTYTYKAGLISGEFSYAAAIGLFNSVVNMIMLVIVNQIARKLGDTSLW